MALEILWSRHQPWRGDRPVIASAYSPIKKPGDGAQFHGSGVAVIRPGGDVIYDLDYWDAPVAQGSAILLVRETGPIAPNRAAFHDGAHNCAGFDSAAAIGNRYPNSVPRFRSCPAPSRARKLFCITGWSDAERYAV